MQPSERYDIIMQKLSVQEMVTIPELMSTFDVSVETVRRDLNYLEKQQYIKKVYGGAILFNRKGVVQERSLRMEENLSEKEAIGRKCAELVEDGDILFLGPGTTVLQVAKQLHYHKDLTVITTSLHATMELLNTDVRIYLIGGMVDNRDANIARPHPENAWDHVCPNKAIIGAGGISVKYGVTDFSISDSLYLGRIISRASTIILAADNSKFGQVHGCITCPLPDVTRIVTGSRQQEDILRDFSAYKQRFLFVNDYTVNPAVIKQDK